MRFRTTLIVVVIFAALAGYVYFAEITGKGQSDEASSGPAETLLWKIPITDVVQIDLSGPDGRTRLARGEGTDWSLVDPMTAATQPADSARIDPILGSLARLQATRSFTNTVDLGEYGLTTPAWLATLRLKSGDEKTLQWGDQTPEGSSYYVKQGKEGTVYVIAAFLVEDLQRLISEPPYPPTPTASPTAEASLEEKATTAPTTGTPARGQATATPPAK
jgi:hypothetical protein